MGNRMGGHLWQATDFMKKEQVGRPEKTIAQGRKGRQLAKAQKAFVNRPPGKSHLNDQPVDWGYVPPVPASFCRVENIRPGEAGAAQGFATGPQTVCLQYAVFHLQELRGAGARPAFSGTGCVPGVEGSPGALPSGHCVGTGASTQSRPGCPESTSQPSGRFSRCHPAARSVIEAYG